MMTWTNGLTAQCPTTGYNMDNAIKFADGMNFQPVPATAPETVRGKIYFEWSKFKDFAEKNVNQRGYVNVKMMKSKNTGGIYFILDDYQPKEESAEAKTYNDNKYKINQDAAQKLFNSPLSEQEQEALGNMPF